jgi:hypothetical protein
MRTRRIAVVLAAALALTASAAAHTGGAHTVPVRVCFPAVSWGPAPDSQRPCLRVLRLHEDGSALITLGVPRDQVRWYRLPGYDGGAVRQGPVR